jgi:transmembrane protein EpsG
MLVYVTVFILTVSIAAVTESGWRRTRPLTFPRGFSLGALIVGGVLFGISALRWRVGTDYRTYEILFPDLAREVTNKELTFFGEPGLRVIAWVAMEISGDSAVMFAIAALITVGLFVRTIWRWSPAFAFGIALYILAGTWHSSFNIVRQYVACAIVFAGHRYIIERKFGKWLFIVSLATLFHVSAIGSILLYFVPTRRTSVKIQSVIIILGIAGMFLMGFVIDFAGQLTGDIRWFGDNVARSVNPLRVIFAFVPIIVYWLFKSKAAVGELCGWFYINALALYAASMLAAANSVLVARFVGYIEPFMIIGLCYATMVASSKDRGVIRCCVLTIFALFMFVEISSNSSLHNFQWIFDRV